MFTPGKKVIVAAYTPHPPTRRTSHRTAPHRAPSATQILVQSRVLGLDDGDRLLTIMAGEISSVGESFWAQGKELPEHVWPSGDNDFGPGGKKPLQRPKVDGGSESGGRSDGRKLSQ